MNFTNEQQLMINTFNILKSNSSINIQLKPIDLKLSYLIFVKLNDLLIFNSTQQSYDYFKIMCPKLGNLLLILGIKILK
jgi:hypothetical protein